MFLSVSVENQKRRSIFFHRSHLDSELLINNGSFSGSAGMGGLEGLLRELSPKISSDLERLIDSGQGVMQ